MNFRDDWPLMALACLFFLLIASLLWLATRSDARRADYFNRCENAGGTPIGDNGDYFCVEKFADMRGAP